jgi:hypothetical protein
MDENRQPQSDPLAPKNLEGLHDAMHSFIESDKRARKLTGKGVVVKRSIPKHHCPCCGCTHTVELSDADRAITPKPCLTCQGQLDEGLICIHTEEAPRRYAFIYSAALVGQPQICQVTAGVMDAVEKRLKEIREASDGERQSQRPAS